MPDRWFNFTAIFTGEIEFMALVTVIRVAFIRWRKDIV
jgi:hypothetical protein